MSVGYLRRLPGATYRSEGITYRTLFLIGGLCCRELKSREFNWATVNELGYVSIDGVRISCCDNVAASHELRQESIGEEISRGMDAVARRPGLVAEAGWQS